MTGYVYMTASQKGGTIYIGVTNDLARRIPEHKSGKGSRFTVRYGVTRLVWYEEHFDIRDAIQREKTLKRWRREWKAALIEREHESGLGGTFSRHRLVTHRRCQLTRAPLRFVILGRPQRSGGRAGDPCLDGGRKTGQWASCIVSRSPDGEAWIPDLRLRYAPASPGMTKVGAVMFIGK